MSSFTHRPKVFVGVRPHQGYRPVIRQENHLPYLELSTPHVGVEVVASRWYGHCQLWCQLFHLWMTKLTIFNGYGEISVMFCQRVFKETSQAEENNDGTGWEEGEKKGSGLEE